VPDITRPILRYFGGKFMLAPWIISHMPKHRVYVEPFGGGASVLLCKPKAWAEIYNDLDGEVVNVFRMLRDRPADLKRQLELTPWARDEYELSKEPTEDCLEQARRTICRSQMGFADATTGPKHAGFRAVMSQGKPASRVFADYPKEVDAFARRLSGVVIENRDAIKVMEEHDTPGTLHFVDPPYVHSTRTSTNNYRHEMPDESHISLCAFLQTLRGMVMLCGYENEIYRQLEWHRIDKAALADGANERVESLWLNPAAVKAMPQADLFREATCTT
jgi:DNA adenine methylase